MAVIGAGVLALRTGVFEMERPPRSGGRSTLPQIDRVAHFDAAEALTGILPPQATLIHDGLMARGGASG